jgi:bis(5'-nucleosyl)-tetraphosphatase (symmetrical)
MATYAIGDLQGCYDELRALLREISFRENRDRLWFTGDLVNRGPASLEVLRFVRALGDRAVTVLGNHDLHLLASAAKGTARPKDTFHDVLAADDREEILTWLRSQPLVHRDTSLGYAMVHAGFPPQWTLAESLSRAREVERCLASETRDEFYTKMYGDTPNRWSNALTGWPRLRFITNALTRMRFCRDDGAIDMSAKGPPRSRRDGFRPWYEMPGRRTRRSRIVFGHWATLHLEAADTHLHGVFALDTGCVWGRDLTAMRLDDGRMFRVPSSATPRAR